MRSTRFLAPAAGLSTGLAGAAAHAAEPKPWEMGFQPAATPVMEGIERFHNGLLLPIITVIALVVLALLTYVVLRFRESKNPVPTRTTHNTLIEVVWTVVPVIILVVIAVPSFKQLYLNDVVPKSDMTLKAIGHQWYWSYEYPDNGNFSYDSNMIAPDELKPGQKRLLDVDNSVVVPVNTTVRVQVTAGDVLHSWAVPAFGVKIDAVPGRLNETWFKVTQEGTYYGQCSELCGTNHGFMPIRVDVVSRDKFDAWVAQKRRAMAPAGEERSFARLEETTR